ncbi:FAD-containing oxidoreductase [Maribacter sp. 2308TA10-17]|uniref:FAD-containing oxidoreductase n=1 Tax=Maribacter sp. 2308TA10-17 TaxID=3386276 RepID=UPI0039BD2F40
MMRNYDSIIIGAGQAGPSLAATLTSKGEKVALIERKWFGGTCVNDGCTPTKTLIASARAAHMVKRSGDFGINVDGDFQVDMKKVMARKDAIVKNYNQGLEKWLRGISNLDLYLGHAMFVDNKTVEVGEEVLKAPKIFINAGNSTRQLRGSEEAGYFTHSEMLNLDFIPEHLLVIGGSYIGLEFAQMYRRFGSKVTVIERGSRVVSREDEQTSLEIQKVLEQEGIDFRFDADCIALSKENENFVANLSCKKGSPTVSGSHALVAIGRTPNTTNLGIENTDLSLNNQGYIIVDDHLKTNVDGIWALGDINGRGGFTHTTYNDFEIVANQLFGDGERSISDRTLCYALFTDPPLARAGMTELQASETGRKILKGYRPFSKVARAVEKSEDAGFMQVLVDGDTEEILGATILGVGGDEVIHALIVAMNAGLSYKKIQNSTHIHPTVSELIPTMLGELELLDNTKNK